MRNERKGEAEEIRQPIPDDRSGDLNDTPEAKKRRKEGKHVEKKGNIVFNPQTGEPITRYWF